MSTVVNGLEEITALAGADLGRTGWTEVTQERVNTFADATGDHQWIHVDTARAAAGPFGGTIAHGYLTLSMVIPLFAELLQVTGISMGINYGLNKVRFPAPVPVGAKIRLAAVIAAVEPVGDGGAVQLTVDFTVEVDGGHQAGLRGPGHLPLLRLSPACGPRRLGGSRRLGPGTGPGRAARIHGCQSASQAARRRTSSRRRPSDAGEQQQHPPAGHGHGRGEVAWIPPGTARWACGSAGRYARPRRSPWPRPGCRGRPGSGRWCRAPPGARHRARRGDVVTVGGGRPVSSRAGTGRQPACSADVVVKEVLKASCQTARAIRGGAEQEGHGQPGDDPGLSPVRGTAERVAIGPQPRTTRQRASSSDGGHDPAWPASPDQGDIRPGPAGSGYPVLSRYSRAAVVVALTIPPGRSARGPARAAPRRCAPIRRRRPGCRGAWPHRCGTRDARSRKCRAWGGP